MNSDGPHGVACWPAPDPIHPSWAGPKWRVPLGLSVIGEIGRSWWRRRSISNASCVGCMHRGALLGRRSARDGFPHGRRTRRSEHVGAVSRLGVGVVLRLLLRAVRAQARGGDRLRGDAARGPVVGARHGDVLDRGQVRVGLDHDDHAARRGDRGGVRGGEVRARLRRGPCRRSIGCGWGGLPRDSLRRCCTSAPTAPRGRRSPRCTSSSSSKAESSPASTMRSTSATPLVRRRRS